MLAHLKRTEVYFFTQSIPISDQVADSSATNHEFLVKEVSFVEFDDVLVFALHQDINLDAVIIKFRLIVDLNLLQRRVGSSHLVPRLHANIHVTSIQCGS